MDTEVAIVMERLLTIQQVMDRLQVADETIYRYIKSGKLRAVRIGGLWRIPSEALDEFLKKGEQGNTGESSGG